MKNYFLMLLSVTIIFFCINQNSIDASPFKKQINESETIKEHTTKIVIYKNGDRVGSGYKVSLRFVGGLLPGYWSDNFYTDSDGVAYIEHNGEGSVEVYVNGDWSNHRTKGKAPGTITVYL